MKKTLKETNFKRKSTAVERDNIFSDMSTGQEFSSIRSSKMSIKDKMKSRWAIHKS